MLCPSGPMNRGQHGSGAMTAIPPAGMGARENNRQKEAMIKDRSPKKRAIMRVQRSCCTNSASGTTDCPVPCQRRHYFYRESRYRRQANSSIQAEPGWTPSCVVEGGKVAGEVKVPHAMINGNVEGDIHATERLSRRAGCCRRGRLLQPDRNGGGCQGQRRIAPHQ